MRKLIFLWKILWEKKITIKNRYQYVLLKRLFCCCPVRRCVSVPRYCTVYPYLPVVSFISSIIYLFRYDGGRARYGPDPPGQPGHHTSCPGHARSLSQGKNAPSPHPIPSLYEVFGKRGSDMKDSLTVLWSRSNLDRLRLLISKFFLHKFK